MYQMGFRENLVALMLLLANRNMSIQRMANGKILSCCEGFLRPTGEVIKSPS